MGHEDGWMDGVCSTNSKFAIHGRMKGIRIYQCCIQCHLHVTFSDMLLEIWSLSSVYHPETPGMRMC